jgi:beta-lactamase superfamily II metal-dependent hydrolase
MKIARLVAACALSVATVVTLSAQPAKGALRIFAVDVEGGQATLFVSPTGQSILVDTGWDGYNGRDADRIVAAAKEAGLSRINAVLITHFHSDHVGGLSQLAHRFPVDKVLIHGDKLPTDDNPPAVYENFKKTLAEQHLPTVQVKAGERLPVAGFDATAISSNGEVISKPLPGAGQPNPLCSSPEMPTEKPTENRMSLGFVMRYAGLTILDAGDLTVDRERPLVCPANKIGHIDLLIVSHHGIDYSSSPVFINAIAPRVAIMDNGDHKGGSTSVIDTIKSSPRLEALYQLHLAPAAGSNNPNGTRQEGPEHNVAEAYIANPAGTDGKRIDIAIEPNGTIDVTNGRTGQTKHFPKK